MKTIISVILVAAILLAGIGVAGAQQYQGSAQPGSAGNGNTLKIPPAPPRPKPNMEYGNTARAAIIAEQLSKAAEGNAKVYISEDKAITVKVYLFKEASPYDIAGTMANFTYMLFDLYSMNEKAGCDIVLKVYDTSGNVIIDAKFNGAKNAFDYFNLPEEAPVSSPPVQPAAGNTPM
jgi:hypothetical protein